MKTQGQGHETTFAQIVAEEIGIHPDDIDVVHGDTDNTPYGLGTYGSRSTPVSGAAAVLVTRKIRDKARLIAAHMLEVAPDDLDWDRGTFSVRGVPGAEVTIQDIARRAHGPGDLPDGMEGALEAQISYSPSNLTYPFGAYICVVDVDPGTAAVKVRRFVAVDDCGTRINEMIVEGQIQGGLTDGVGIALMEIVSFDKHGNCLNASLMDYLIPTALEVPDWENGKTVTPSPHHPIGAKGVGESATVGSPPAVVNAVIDALEPYGVRHVDMPLTPSRVWEAMQREEPPSYGRPDDPDPAACLRDRGAARLGQGRRRGHRRHRGRGVAARRPAPQGARRPALHPHRRPGWRSRRAGCAWPAGRSRCSASRTAPCSRCARPARAAGCSGSAPPPCSPSTPPPA